jgi:hypothetical protein
MFFAMGFVFLPDPPLSSPMPSLPPSGYEKMSELDIESDRLQVFLASTTEDPPWDAFLRSTPLGQYQQSSLWAGFKAGEGWRHHRVVVTNSDGAIRGGYQILWRKKGPVRLGYVSKGPVAHPESPVLQLALLRHVAQSASELSLQALIVQLPDETTVDTDALAASAGLIRSNPMDVVEATYLVDVGAGMETVRKRMHRNVRQCVRKALEQGLTIRSGTEDDLPLFFDLMSATCRRQNTSPNPDSLASLRLLWRTFAKAGAVEMSFAGRDGRDVAGRLNLLFGQRATQWKKGWDGSNPGWHANELLADQALEWAHQQGYRWCDYIAMNRLTAEHLLAGRPTGETIARSRDMFNLRLGGQPRLLPRAQLLLPNPMLRWGYRMTWLPRERQREQQLLAART